MLLIVACPSDLVVLLLLLLLFGMESAVRGTGREGCSSICRLVLRVPLCYSFGIVKKLEIGITIA